MMVETEPAAKYPGRPSCGSIESPG